MFEKLYKNNGISPVIGVILLVAVTVALISLATVIVFDIGSDVSDTADATVQLSESENGVQASIIRNENVNEFILKGPDGSESIINNVGESTTIVDGEGTYTVIAILEDGSEEVLTSTIISSSSTGETLTGTVSTNPPIEGAIVEAIRNEEIIDSDTTDSEGVYTLDVDNTDELEIFIDTQGVEVEINGETKEFYGSVTQQATGSLDIEFTDVSARLDSDNNEIWVSNDVSEGEISDDYLIEFSSIVISNVEDLQNINNDLSANYLLKNDIDASETVNWNVLQSGTEMTEEKFTFGGFDKGEQIELPYHIQEIKSVVDTDTGEDVNIIIISNEDGIIEIDTESEPEDIKITYTIEEHVLGFKPIGNEDNAFTGTLDGQGYEIEGLTIDRPDEDNIGLLGNTGDSSEIENIGMVNYNIHGNSDVGGLVGTNNGEIYNTYIELIEDNTMSSDNPRMGGLVGKNNGIISTSYSIIQGEIKSSGNYIGGFVGLNQIEGTISNSYSITEGTISGSSQTSGFLGFNDANLSGDSGTVENSYYNGADDENIPSGTDDSVQLIKEDMLGDNYDNEFETDIVNNNSFIGITNDYPILEWQNNE